MSAGKTAPDTAAARTRRAAGELEAEVLAALWTAANPLTPRQLQDAIDGNLAYNTVHTILTRLYDKGMVSRVRLDGRSAYTPTKAASQLAAERMRAVLDQGPDRMTTLAHFVQALGPDDEQVLRDLLAKHTPQ